jgi:hypothetical protein
MPSVLGAGFSAADISLIRRHVFGIRRLDAGALNVNVVGSVQGVLGIVVREALASIRLHRAKLALIATNLKFGLTRTRRRRNQAADLTSQVASMNRNVPRYQDMPLRVCVCPRGHRDIVLPLSTQFRSGES